MGNGKQFYGKSNVIQFEGEWNSQGRLEATGKFYDGAGTLIPNPNPKISKIKIVSTNHLNNEHQISPQPEQKYQQSESQPQSWCAFDQLYYEKDLKILQGTGWLNSSIIDGYINFLNYTDQKTYWEMDNRQNYNRMFIFANSVFSNFHENQNEMNQYNFKKEFLEYEPIEYKLWKIFKKIGMVINQNNSHWYFVIFDFKSKLMIIQDSIRGMKQHYKTVKNILEQLFSDQNEQINFEIQIDQKCLQQNNGYDCGNYIHFQTNFGIQRDNISNYEKQEQIFGILCHTTPIVRGQILNYNFQFLLILLPFIFMQKNTYLSSERLQQVEPSGVEQQQQKQLNTPYHEQNKVQIEQKPLQNVPSPGKQASPIKQYDPFDQLLNLFINRFKKEQEAQDMEQQIQVENLSELFSKLNYLSYQKYMNKQQKNIVFTIVVPDNYDLILQFLDNCDDFKIIKPIIRKFHNCWEKIKAIILQATTFSIQIILTQQEIQLYQFKVNEEQQNSFRTYLQDKCKIDGQLQFKNIQTNPFSFYLQNRKEIVDNEFHCFQDRIVYPIQGQPFNISYLVSKDSSTYYGQVKNKKRHGFGYTFQRNYDQFHNNRCSIQSAIYENDDLVVSRPNRVTKYWGQSLIKCQTIHYYGRDIANSTQLFDGSGKSVAEKKSKIKISSVISEPSDKQNKQIEVEVEEKQKQQQQQQQQQPESWCQYDALIYPRDLEVLKSNQWLNSSIIDAYVQYLNQSNYNEQFKNQDFSKRKFVIDSTFYTNTEQNATNQVDQYLASKCIEFPTDIISIFDIFETILLVINVSNSHWHSIQIRKVEQRKYEYIIYDSMFGNVKNYRKKCQIIDNAIQRSIKTKFTWNNNILDGKSPQQRDGYSCGDHTCMNLKYLMNDQPLNYKQQDLMRMRIELYELVRYK